MIMNFSIHGVVSVKVFKTQKNTVEEIGTYFSKGIEIMDNRGVVIKINLYSHGKKGELTIISEEGFR